MLLNTIFSVKISEQTTIHHQKSQLLQKKSYINYTIFTEFIFIVMLSSNTLY